MEINDELIACYVEGTATLEEQNLVRKYLIAHPNECERILCLMDRDVEDYLEERVEVVDKYLPMNETSFADIALSTAAFAPAQNPKITVKKPLKQNGIHDKLKSLCTTLDNIKV